MNTQLIPLPQVNVSVRVATIDDYAFIDLLQKKHNKALGFLQTAAIEGKIARGEIVVAEDGAERVGYCIGSDRYFKHDDVGIIYQMNVVPGRQRQFIATALLKAQFDRSAYGCKLHCCWCAQDLSANKFWEAMGFVPLAYRAGSEKRARTHIFWQKRIRRDDVTTPWWFPVQTGSGAIREDRLVLPIPPGLRWDDPMPVRVMPREKCVVERGQWVEKKETARSKHSARAALPTNNAQLTTSSSVRRGGLRFGTPPAIRTEAVVKVEAPVKPVREKKPKAKNDPRIIAAARELRDRWLEHVNGGGMLLESDSKYDVTRSHEGERATKRVEIAPVWPALPAPSVPLSRAA